MKKKMKFHDGQLVNILIAIIIIAYSIQNKIFANFQVINLGFIRLDIADFSIIGAIVILFIYLLMKKRIKLNKLLVFIIIYMTYELCYGLVSKYSIFNIFMDFRSIVYLLLFFIVFKNIIVDKIFLINIFKVGAFINSIYYMYRIFNSSTSGSWQRDVSFNLFIGTFYLGLCYFYIKKKKISDYIVIVLVIIASLFSQQRSIIIPNAIIIVIYIYRNLFIYKQINSTLKTILMIGAFGIIVWNIMEYSGFSNILINRLSVDNFVGEESTMNFRVDSVKYFLDTTPKINLFFGSGLGSTTLYYSNINVLTETINLEILIANYLLKYGIVGICILVIYFTREIKRNFINNNNNFNKQILLTFVCILTGGIISGLGGYSGQLLIGISLGLVSNKRITD